MSALRRLVAFAAGSFLPAVALHAQDRLHAMPGYDQFTRMAPQYQGTVKSGSIIPDQFSLTGGRFSVTPPSAMVAWMPDGKSFDYTLNGTRYRFDVVTKRSRELSADEAAAGLAAASAAAATSSQAPAARRTATTPTHGCGTTAIPPVERGRQSPVAISPDGAHIAHYHDRNIYVCDASGAGETAITKDGSEAQRIKSGTASWVYGEELGQTTAMWWNPASTKLAYFRFDESGVPDFYITQDETKLQTKLDVEAYPKAGVKNPVVELYVYDLASHATTKVDVRNGKPFTDDVLGHYVYDVRWAPNGQELLVHRTNRRQNVVELAACSPVNGACRVVVHEEWPTGWVENHPGMRFLADSSRFIWQSERNGYKNFYLYDLTGKLHGAITTHPFETASIVRVDEPTNTLWYTARDGDNYMKLQLHRVGLDGKGDRRLTDPAFNHTVSLSPDGRTFIDVAQTHDKPPTSSVIDATNGRTLATIATSDVSAMQQRGIHTAEMFTYTAADGTTKLYGEMWVPSNFDASKKYPVLALVYGGPASASNVPTETFSPGNPLTEYGFIVVQVSSRAAPGQGKRSLDAIYMKLGQTEMDDMANGIKSLWTRPYIDKDRIGIYGTSYGGYTSVMEILRHPEVFAVASSESPVTDWRNYDSIYTERYMWIPAENKDGYDKGSAMSYVKNLQGRLMLYYGTLDNNVHNTNMMQLITALQGAGKSFDLQAGPDLGHTSVNSARRMEFLIENLVMRPDRVRMGY